MQDSATIQTFTGRHFSLLDPQLEDIDIQDIAHALSHMCRFTGHTSEFYSVAQHSVLVSLVCEPEDRKHALLHDAAEAFCCDISRPLKYLPEMARYKDIEHVIQSRIYEAFHLAPEYGPSVKAADNRLVRAEAAKLMRPIPSWASVDPDINIIPMSPRYAKSVFLDRFHELFN